MVSEQVAHRVAEPFEVRQDLGERFEITVDCVSEVQGEREVLQREIGGGCFEFRDRFPVVSLTRRIGVGILDIGDHAEGEQWFLGSRHGLRPSPCDGGGSRGEGDETSAVHGVRVSRGSAGDHGESVQFGARRAFVS